jgi:hypothetical protein
MNHGESDQVDLFPYTTRRRNTSAWNKPLVASTTMAIDQEVDSAMLDRHGLHACMRRMMSMEQIKTKRKIKR